MYDSYNFKKKTQKEKSNPNASMLIEKITKIKLQNFFDFLGIVHKPKRSLICSMEMMIAIPYRISQNLLIKVQKAFSFLNLLLL